jgi:hypothetical protein
MRRTPVVASVVLALAVSGGVAYADGAVDPVAATALPGVLAISGAGTTASVSATIGQAKSFGTSVLTVTDATGATAGWDVTATYGALADLTGLDIPEDATTADIGGANITVLAATSGAQKTANTAGGVGESALVFQPAATLATPVKIAKVAGDGRGTTVFGTSYTIALPPKSSEADVVYTGKVVYTVAAHQ